MAPTQDIAAHEHNLGQAPDLADTLRCEELHRIDEGRVPQTLSPLAGEHNTALGRSLSQGAT